MARTFILTLGQGAWIGIMYNMQNHDWMGDLARCRLGGLFALILEVRDFLI